MLVSLKLTPLRLANVPPPMALHTLTLERKAIDVAISESGSRLAVLSGNDLAVYALDMHKRPLPKPVLLWRNDAIKDHCPRHVTFIGDEHLFVLTDTWDEDESFLWRTTGEVLEFHGPIIEAEGVSSLVSNVGYSELYVQFLNGALHQLDAVETSTDLPPVSSPIHQFASLASEVKVVAVEGQVCRSRLRRFQRTNKGSHWLSGCPRAVCSTQMTEYWSGIAHLSQSPLLTLFSQLPNIYSSLCISYVPKVRLERCSTIENRVLIVTRTRDTPGRAAKR